MAIKVKLKNGVFEPLEKVMDLERKYKDKEIQIEILPQIDEFKKEIIKKDKLFWRGALKNLKISSVELQHKINNLW
mgnify:CR=1 FL=1